MGDEVLVFLCSTDQNEIEKNISENNIDKLVGKIKIFDDADACAVYLLTIYEERIFLRLGCGFSHLLSIFNDFNQIYYIYPSETSECEKNLRIRDVFIDHVQFFKQLKSDLEYWKNHYAYLTFSDACCQRMETTTTIGIESRAARFMWSQTLLEILLNIPSPPNNPQRDFIEEAKHLYHDNKYKSREIDQFGREYRSQDAIKWYTRDSFVYRLVNKALRTRDIYLIFKFRFFIQDVYKQLKDLQQNKLKGFLLK